MTRWIALWRRFPIVGSAFLLALIVTLVLTARAALFAVYWADPERRDEALQGWMTPRYVAMSRRLAPEVVREILGLGQGDGRRQTLAEIARERGVPLSELIDALEAAARADAKP